MQEHKLTTEEQSTAFCSRLFVVKKEGSEDRPVFDLRDLNRFVRKQHFKMEGLHTVVELLRPNDLMTRIDLHKACLHVPVSLRHQRH